MVRGRFFLFFIPAALIAVVTQHWGPIWLHLIFKPVPALLCAWLAFAISADGGNGKKVSYYLTLAFVFCSVGDLLLLFETAVFEGNPFFLLGMASFALAHVCFIYAMIGGVPVSNINAKRHWGQLATATLLLVFGVEFFILNRESFGELKMAILTYCVALVVMSIAASLRMLHHGTESYLLVLSGAVVFMGSDALLATVRFTDHIDIVSFLILPMYFAAIGMMCYGFSLGKMVENPGSSESGR